MIKNLSSSKVPDAETDAPRLSSPEGDPLNDSRVPAQEETSTVVDITEHRQKSYDYSRIRNGMYSYLLENQFLTQSEFDKAANDAKLQKEPIESILISELKIPKEEVL
ncbi:MAG: hypothetical protein V3S89_15820, partial [Desulfobacterales bacterium]